MKPFGKWIMESPVNIKEDDLIYAECCVCGKDIDFEDYGIDPKDVTEDDEFYCGCSPRCCP